MPFILPGMVGPIRFPTYPVVRNPPVSTSGKVNPSVQSGRSGAGTNPAVNDNSAKFVFTDSLSGSQVKTYPLPTTQNWVSAVFTVTTAVTSGSTAAGTHDILTGYSNLQILDASSTPVNMTPAPDFYNFAQRFSELHVRPSVVNVTGVASSQASATGTYVISGLNLPKSRGPYQLRLTAQSPTSFDSNATALTVTTTLALTPGNIPNNSETNYTFSGLPFTPSANGTNDLSPLASVQGVSLTELFLTGQTSDTADMNTLLLESQGQLIGDRIIPSDLVAQANNAMVSALPSDTTYLLFPLHTNIVLGTDSSMLITWGASPSDSIRVGYYYLK